MGDAVKLLALALAACATPAVSQRTDAVEVQSARPMLQSALDAVCGGGTVTVPAGRWVLDRAPAGSYNRFAALSTHCNDIMIRGVGPESVLALEGDQGGQSIAVISIDPGAAHIRVADLTIDTSAATNTDEQTHAIATSGVCSGSTCQPIRDVSIERVTFRHPRTEALHRKGDCIRLLGNSDTTRLIGTRIVGNDFAECARSAIMIQRGVTDLVIAGNTLNAVKTCIDGEATGGYDARITITGNAFRPGCSPSLSLTNTTGATVVGNTMASGVTVYRSTGVAIMGNTVTQEATGDTGTIDVANVCDGLAISGNTIVRTGAMGPVIKLAPHSGGICQHAAITGNSITQQTAAWGIYLESVSAVAVTGNQLTFASAPAYSGIYERSVLAAPITGVIVANNLISGPLTYGVQLHASPGQFGAGVVVKDNLATGTTFPLYLNNPAGFTEPP